MKKGLLLMLFFMTSLTYSFGQLNPGDIMITCVQTDSPDTYTFVALVSIPSGTVIYFTDNGVFSDGTLRGGEGTDTYTVPAAGLSVGDVVVRTGLTGLSTGGDQVIAYVGTLNNPTTYICAAQTNSSLWQSTATNSNTSALPTGLIDGYTAIALGVGTGSTAEIDNSQYTGSRDMTGLTKEALLAVISNTANWTGSNSALTIISSNFTGVLPITLMSFDAKKSSSNVELSWTTAQEINNNYFTIERSFDGKSFDAIGKVAGSGNSDVMTSYTYSDEAPLRGVNYYRLMQTDIDGTFTYSEVIAIQVGKNGNVFVAPTFVNETTTVYFDEAVRNATDFVIYNVNGQAVYSNTVAVGASNLDISALNFRAGQYYIRFADATINTLKFVKL